LIYTVDHSTISRLKARHAGEMVGGLEKLGVYIAVKWRGFL
jgi:hypothetical protein